MLQVLARSFLADKQGATQKKEKKHERRTYNFGSRPGQ